MANWDMFREMDNLRRELDRFMGAGRLEPGFLPGLGAGRYPHVNVLEDGDNLYVEALIPGLDPKDLELTILKGSLTLSGERRDTNARKKTWHRNERGAGKFLRTVELPIDIDADRARAECRNGILTITLPKAEASKPRKITVQTH
jgi:HSP20 family protein